MTHLPQLAAMADTHFSVEKGEENGRTFTRVVELGPRTALRGACAADRRRGGDRNAAARRGGAAERGGRVPQRAVNSSF